MLYSDDEDEEEEEEEVVRARTDRWTVAMDPTLAVGSIPTVRKRHRAR